MKGVSASSEMRFSLKFLMFSRNLFFLWGSMSAQVHLLFVSVGPVACPWVAGLFALLLGTMTFECLTGLPEIQGACQSQLLLTSLGFAGRVSEQLAMPWPFKHNYFPFITTNHCS